jgi:subtilase family serine protease
MSLPSYDTGNVRGYPDISANGANFVVAANGALYLVFGTSAVAPTVGSITFLINEQRIKAKKSVVGFINPVLYANPTALHDITSGGNAGCGTSGFTAVPGVSFAFPSCGKRVEWIMLIFDSGIRLQGWARQIILSC